MVRRKTNRLAPLPVLLFGTFLTVTVSLLLQHHYLSLQPFLECPTMGLSLLATRRPEKVEMEETAACLCVMDDNHFLTEWIAYHYHTVNLRHLIITIDPDSLTSPARVLERWRDRIQIEEWTDDNFTHPNFDKIVNRKATGNKVKSLVNHRVRQAQFNLECLKALKRQNRGWTLMIDTDEYLTPNPEASPPSMETPGSSLKVLQQIMVPDPKYTKIISPCLPVHRQQFSARESELEQVQADLPDGFDGRDFQTLRWRKYGYHKVRYKTQWEETCSLRRWVPNKVVIDLGRLRLADLEDPDHRGNPHRPLETCPKDVYMTTGETPLLVNHFMGTNEQWLYRQGDKRGQGYRLARYEDLNEMIGVYETDQLRPWLRGFVKSVGAKEAKRLLDRVGQVDPLPNRNLTAPLAVDIGGEIEYQVGEVVQADYKGDGEWRWAEISAKHETAKGFYNVIYADDCGEEIATFASRIRRSGKTDDGLSNTIFFKEWMNLHEDLHTDSAEEEEEEEDVTGEDEEEESKQEVVNEEVEEEEAKQEEEKEEANES